MERTTSKWTWIFAGQSVVQAAICLALEIYVFVQFDESKANETNRETNSVIPTFLSLYIFAFVYQLILVWDALRRQNTIQVIGLVLLNVGLLVYGAVQYAQIKQIATNVRAINQYSGLWAATRSYLIAVPCIIAFVTLGLAFTAYKLYKEFAWKIYKHISADLRMKQRYLTYQIYVALLKFDIFFTLGFTIQFVIIVGGKNAAEKYLTVAAIPITIIIMLAAFYVTRLESMIGSIVVIILYFAGLAYFCFKLGRMYTPGFEAPYLAARKELTTFAVLTIALLVCTIVVACMCARNYGKGLMPYVRTRAGKRTSAVQKTNGYSGFEGHGESSYNSQGYGYEPSTGMDGYTKPGRPLAPTRMEID